MDWGWQRPQRPVCLRHSLYRSPDWETDHRWIRSWTIKWRRKRTSGTTLTNQQQRCMMASDLHNTCSFCGKHKDSVKKLIVGEKVGICNECVDLCQGLLVDETPQTVTDKSSWHTKWFFQELNIIKMLPYNNSLRCHIF